MLYHIVEGNKKATFLQVTVNFSKEYSIVVNVGCIYNVTNYENPVLVVQLSTYPELHKYPQIISLFLCIFEYFLIDIMLIYNVVFLEILKNTPESIVLAERESTEQVNKVTGGGQMASPPLVHKALEILEGLSKKKWNSTKYPLIFTIKISEKIVI